MEPIAFDGADLLMLSLGIGFLLYIITLKGDQ